MVSKRLNILGRPLLIGLILLLATYSNGWGQTDPKIKRIYNPESQKSNHQDRADLSHCLDKADAELNTLYKKILIKNQLDQEFIKKLKKAELAWIRYRDVEAEFEKRSHTGGYPEQDRWIRSMISLTIERTARLEKLLDRNISKNKATTITDTDDHKTSESESISDEMLIKEALTIGHDDPDLPLNDVDQAKASFIRIEDVFTRYIDIFMKDIDDSDAQRCAKANEAWKKYRIAAAESESLSPYDVGMDEGYISFLNILADLTHERMRHLRKFSKQDN